MAYAQNDNGVWISNENGSVSMNHDRHGQPYFEIRGKNKAGLPKYALYLNQETEALTLQYSKDGKDVKFINLEEHIEKYLDGLSDSSNRSVSE